MKTFFFISIFLICKVFCLAQQPNLKQVFSNDSILKKGNESLQYAESKKTPKIAVKRKLLDSNKNSSNDKQTLKTFDSTFYHCKSVRPITMETSSGRGMIFNDSQKSDWPKYFIGILGVIVGFILNKSFDFLKEKIDTKKQGIRWNMEIYSFQNAISNQIGKLEAFMEDVNSKFPYNSPLNVSVRLNGSVFETLDRTMLFKYLSNKIGDTKKANEIYSDFDANLSAVRETFKYTQSTFSESKQNVSKCFEEYNLVTQKLRTSLNNLKVKVLDKSINYSEESFKKLSKIYTNYSKVLGEGSIPFFNLKDDYIEPMKALLYDFESIPEIANVMTCLIESLDSIEHLKAEKGYYISNLSSLTELFKEHEKDFNKVVKSFPA